jgi:hypothetical protein
MGMGEEPGNTHGHWASSLPGVKRAFGPRRREAVDPISCTEPLWAVLFTRNVTTIEPSGCRTNKPQLYCVAYLP